MLFHRPIGAHTNSRNKLQHNITRPRQHIAEHYNPVSNQATGGSWSRQITWPGHFWFFTGRCAHQGAGSSHQMAWRCRHRLPSYFVSSTCFNYSTTRNIRVAFIACAPLSFNSNRNRSHVHILTNKLRVRPPQPHPTPTPTYIPKSPSPTMHIHVHTSWPSASMIPANDRSHSLMGALCVQSMPVSIITSELFIPLFRKTS